MAENAAIETSTGNPLTTRRLYRWLTHDESLRPGVQVRLRSRTDSTEPLDDLGDTLEIISVVVTSVMALPPFIESVRRWFRDQPPPAPAPVVLRHGNIAVEIPTDTDAAVISALTAALATQPVPPPDPVSE
ncbi:hypothetical protein OG802_11090 [Streptomyces sp. NBC_00704]|uniref:effector-associated constant component EACC1 n=1 Tax=Streptomyces sp. NBC_00704 TaxID=2975809 RepID=UPI002E2F9E04|nr:hypothetical protein [Streptomyces sp. NBC_00704]